MNGKVVWINHKAQANRPAGFAVQIGTDVAGQKIKHEVERLLAGKIDSQQATYTM
jgi:type IV pilus assembly protein PilZ